VKFRFASLVGRALWPLALATVCILGAAVVIVYWRDVAREKAVVVDGLETYTAQRSLRERVDFDRIERQLRAAERLLKSAVTQQHEVVAPPYDGTGSRRRLPEPGDVPVAAFVTATAVDDQEALQAVSLAEALLRDMGPLWSEGLAEISVMVPDRWLVGYGNRQVELVADLLPEDRILLEEPLPTGHHGVVWMSPVFEPASETWSVAAQIAVPVFGDQEALIRQDMPIDQLLARAGDGAPPGTHTLVLDANGGVLAGSGPQQSPGSLPPGLAAILAQSPSAATTVIDDSIDGCWVGITHLPGPQWNLVTILPHAQVEAVGATSVANLWRIGLLIIVLQLAMVAVFLGRGVSRPLRALLEAAQRLARGERGLQLASGRRDEIGELGRAFETMDQAIAAREQDLRASAEALREREGFARALVEGAADAVLVIEDGVIVDANPRAAMLFGEGKTQLVGTRFATLAADVQADLRSSEQAFLAWCLATGDGPQHFPWLTARLDGHEFDAEIGLARLDLPGSIRYLAVVRDVTERNRLEAQVRHAQRMESVGQLAGGVAHDFNNVLTAIMGSAELLSLASVTPERKAALLTSIITACQRASGLTRTLLDFSRRKQVASTPVDIQHIITDTIALLERSIDRRIRIEHDFHADQSAIIGDSAQLQNALLNLGINARDAMPDGGIIRYATSIENLDAFVVSGFRGDLEPGKHVLIRVSDSGPGIPTELIERIFEPFFTTKPVGKGTGLGLAAVYRTVCDHHGGILVENDELGGARFVIALPLTRSAPAPVSERAIAATHTGTVLVIDDEDPVRQVAAALLEDLGHIIIEARDGNEGIAVYRERQAEIDVVIIDMEMPGLRGTDCVRELLRIDPGVYAILCSGFAREDGGSWQEAGFKAAIAKPYRMTDLQAAVELGLSFRKTKGDSLRG
jgi:PAS domain S-box-containing protein